MHYIYISNFPTDHDWIDTGTANREENYAKKAADFEHHSKRMADTASALAKTGGVTDRKLANDLISTSKGLYPHVY